MPAKNQKTLSHAEIWDDSALIDSWDEAVEEYKRYHSINARGEDVEDVLREVEMKERALENGVAGSQAAAEAVEDSARDAGKAHDELANVKDAQENGVGSYENAPDAQMSNADGKSSTAASKDLAAESASIPLPPPLLNKETDEPLKNLMMSWYYAGYYTGLYQGQQQARSKST